MILSKDIPGGNLQVISQDGRNAVIEEEIRGSKNPWFYWKFSAVFSEPGEYHFHFTNPNKIGPRSAAVSTDHGKSWSWLTRTAYPDSQNFSFVCEKPGEYWFCQCIPYMQTDFEAFAAEFKNHPAFSVSSVGKTKKGRSVELVTVKQGNPKDAILLTARHHCQESMASYALEGILRTVLADTEFGRDFRSRYALYAIPFVDKDGVEDGDQGKGRIPRDHARDYEGESLYPEITAIRAFIKKIKPFFMLDMHCPWIRFGSNEYSYMTQGSDFLGAIEVERFASVLEKESPACAPFHKSDILHWGVDWNVRANSMTGTMSGYGLKGFAQHEMAGIVRACQTVEIPFANFREQTITAKEGRLFGEGLAHTIRKFHELLLEEDRKNQGPRQAVLCFAGTIPPEGDTAALDALKSTMSAADYRIGFLNTVFGPADQSDWEKTLASAGFDLVSTANAHALDQGYEGLYQSLYRVDHAGIEHTGTARSIEEREKVVLKEVEGIRIAFIAYTVPFDAVKSLTEEQASFAVSVLPVDGPCESLAQDIQRARSAGADSVIVLLDFSGCPRKTADTIVARVMAMGADLAIGNDPAAASVDGGPLVTVTLRKENGKTSVCR